MNNKVKIIPTPKSAVISDGQTVISTSACTVCDDFKSEVLTFNALSERLFGVHSDGSSVELTFDGTLGSGEYRIECAEDKICAYASDRDGASYAMSSVLQLVTVKEWHTCVPHITVNDRPDCNYRSLMLDLSFKYHTPAQLKDIIDLCYLYKIKFIHLHFVDNKGYTLPSKAFPKLPAACQSYTREEIADLNEYALCRNVEIIPELEFPGHCAALVSAYPELFENRLEDTPEAEEFRKGYHNNVICVGKEGIMESVETMIRETIEMFPNSRYLHIGGDEAEIETWSYCPDCRRYMEEKGINGVYPLYSHFIKLVTDKVLELGRTPIVWEGFPKEGAEQISRNVIVIAWESLYHIAPDLVEEGFNIVNASWQPLYLVVKRHWKPQDILAWNIYNWQNWWEKSYAYNNPINIKPTNQVLGGQISSWWGGEYGEETELIKRNLAALSERTWNIERLCTDDEFMSKLDALLPLADTILK